jgi:phosphoribosylglycinamide formyltransferase-1
VSPAPARRVVVLISGRGSNMQRLIEHSRAAGARYEVVAVLSDQPAAPGLALAREFGCTVKSLGAKAYADRSAYDAALADAIQDHAPDLVVLAGFMRILTAAFVRRFEGRMLNIHPSLLPLYPGLHTHRRVLAARESVHGATVHFVTAELDGGPAVIQGRVDVDRDDDEISLSRRVQGVEHRIYPLAVDWFCGGRLEQRDGRAWLDGTWLREPIQWSDTARESS